MKILQYTGGRVINAAGGGERVFCEMANALVVRGHEVYAVCNDFRAGRLLFPLDNRVHFINLDGSGQRKIKPITWFKGIWSVLLPGIKAMLERYVEDPINQKKGEPLVQLIREVQPDVVIPYFVGDYFSMLRQPMLNVPVILMNHHSAVDFTKSVNTRGKVAKINTCPHLQVLLHSFIPEIQKVYHGSIHVIPNVVPHVEEKDMADLTVEKPQKTIVMISRLEPGKQQHLLIQSFKRLAKDYPEWKVEIYGPPSKQKYLRQLESMIVSQELVGRVELMGATNHSLGILRKADIFAFPSISEGWGLTLTEAMAVGLPCVGLKTTPSVNELIVDGVNGFLANNTPEDFAEKLKILMDNRDLCIKMGKNGHEMMKEYAPEKIWDQWENLLFRLIHEEKAVGC